MPFMWCGNPARHAPHRWGRWLQHFCRGKSWEKR